MKLYWTCGLKFRAFRAEVMWSYSVDVVAAKLVHIDREVVLVEKLLL